MRYESFALTSSYLHLLCTDEHNNKMDFSLINVLDQCAWAYKSDIYQV